MSYHNQTIHTYEKLQNDRHFMNWATQPSGFKTYPHFFQRRSFDELKDSEYWKYLGAINSTVKYVGGSYTLRVIPSAGALYPCELYLQIRGVSGFEDGIYHYETKTNSLVFLYAITNDGVEKYLGLNIVKGIIYLVSSVYFRSTWKYRLRSFRYSLLDAGHQMGAIEIANSLYEKPLKILFEFEKEKLNTIFGFEDKEFFLVAGYSGEESSDEVKPLRENLPIVAGSDYFIPKAEILQAYKNTLLPNSHEMYGGRVKFEYEEDKLKDAIWNRRSIRGFKRLPIEKEEYQFIYKNMTKDINSNSYEEVNIYAIVHRVNGLESGIYENGFLINKGEFENITMQLSLGQELARDCSVVFFFTGKWQNYQNIMMKAGMIGHRAYIASEYLGIGASGIGAYFDNDVKEFLKTDEHILYTFAIGR